MDNVQLANAVKALRTNTATHVPYMLLYESQEDVLSIHSTSANEVSTTSTTEEEQQANAAVATASVAVAAAVIAAETTAAVATAASLAFERFRPINPEDLRVVHALLSGPSNEEIVKQKGSTRETMLRFREHGLLSGDIMSFLFLSIFSDRKNLYFLILTSCQCC
jgi:hypothetical protein